MMAWNFDSKTEDLSTVLLVLRAVIRINDNVSAAQMLYGTNIRIPGNDMAVQLQTFSQIFYKNTWLI